MGPLGVLIISIAVVQLFGVLIRGALRRGRDSFYAAAAGACLVTVSYEAFCDSSFTYLTVQTLLAITVGLGLSQTTGKRTLS